MIVRLNKGVRSYYAAPYTFTKENPEQKVSAELGGYLLGTGYFKKIKDIEREVKIENTNLDPEEEASEQKKLYDEAQKESKKKSTKKEDK